VWLYNAAGLSYGEVGEHESAVAWLGEGIEVAMSAGDPEGLVGQLSDLRRRSLEALAREHDELEQRVGLFLEEWHRRPRPQRPWDFPDATEADEHGRKELAVPGATGSGIEVATAWFPAGEYENAIEHRPNLAELWADVAHADYSRRMDGHMKWSRAQGLIVRSIAPILLEDYLAWCDERGEDPGQARASYAAHRLADGDVLAWPPGRNEPCWCGSGRKYKRCCDMAAAAPMHDVAE